MNKLSKLGREEICKRIGIKDKNSIFIKSREAFVDRMSLLNIYYGIQNLIDIYRKEMETFDSEKEYIKFLRESEIKLYNSISSTLDKATMIVNSLNKNINFTYVNYKTFFKENDNSYKLRIYCDSPIYESIKYYALFCPELESSFKEYVKINTNSEYLATLNDFDINMFSEEKKKLINKLYSEMSLTIFGLLSPKYINSNELYELGNAEAIYITSPNRTVKSVDTMIEYFNNTVLEKTKLNIDIYRDKRISKILNITKRESIISNDKNNIYNIKPESTLDLVYYLRYMYGESNTDYDKYFEINGKEAKLLSHIEVADDDLI